MGQSVFLTEKQVESWLEFETRDLPMPDGSIRPFTDFRFQWEKFDELVSLAGYTPIHLIELALEETQISGHPIDDTLRGGVCFLYQHIDFLIAKKKKKDKVKTQIDLLIAKKSRKDTLKEQAKHLKGTAKKAFGQIAFRGACKKSSF